MSHHPKSEKLRIGITLGDINGVGPEVVIKSLGDSRMLNMVTPVVYGSARVLSYYKKQLNIEDFTYSQVRNRGQYTPKQVNVVNTWDETLEAH
ncbi:MAG TPA: 4-hydroxythreonine-4-phosphate dehydrogenase PdxA, partial [Cyclobacteriaceae bacterium]|nr:4-hydroxythreonine-4-phosphate dehydrogenase PdxA [Cyclobacteriaceae bacterium]